MTIAESGERAKLDGRTVVASLSTGKDSVAMCLYLKEQGIEHERVFFDTKWEHTAVSEHLEYLRKTLGPVTDISGPLGMVELIRSKGMFPSRQIRFCTEELKVFPMREYITARTSAGEDIVNAVGVRRGESVARASALEWEHMPDWDCDQWRPLVDWTVDDVIAIHKRHGIKPNRLYLMGFSRVGCFPCHNATKAETRLVAELGPTRIDAIRALELELGTAAKLRYDARATAHAAGTLSKRDRKHLLDDDGKVKPFRPSTFFRSPFGDGESWGIDRVVEWSRTKYGGKAKDDQMDLLAFGGVNDGCMRWGLCETRTP